MICSINKILDKLFSEDFKLSSGVTKVCIINGEKK